MACILSNTTICSENRNDRQWFRNEWLNYRGSRFKENFSKLTGAGLYEHLMGGNIDKGVWDFFFFKLNSIKDAML